MLQNFTDEHFLYLVQYLPTHLKQARDWTKLRRILSTFDFLQQKVNCFGPQSLVADFDDSHDGELLKIQEGIRLATHLLLRDSSLLATQLYSRLVDLPGVPIQILLKQIEMVNVPWLRLLSRSLPRPGDRLIRTFAEHENSATCIALMPDGKRVISGSRDHTLILWNIETGANQVVFYGHTAPIISVTVSQDGQWIASGDEGGKIIFWNDQGHLLHEFAGHDKSVTQVEILTNSQNIVSASTDGSVKVWRLDSARLQLIIPTMHDRVMTFDIMRDENILFAGGSDGMIRGWSLQNGQLVCDWKAFPGTVTALCVVPHHQWIVALAADFTLKIWNYPTGNEIRTFDGISRHDIEEQFPSRRLSVSADGRMAAYAFGKSNLRAVELETGDTIGTFQAHSWPINAVKFTRDGSHLITASQDATLRIWRFEPDLFNDNNTLAHQDDVSDVIFGPDASVGISCSLDSSIKFWNMANATLITTVEQPGVFLYAVRIALNGQYLISAGFPQSVVVWDIPQKAIKHQLVGHLESPLHIDLSVDTTRLFTISGTELIEWDIESGEIVHRLKIRGIRFIKVFSTPIQNLVIVTCSDNTARVIDFQNDKELAIFDQHHDLIENILVLPEAEHVISGSRDGSIYRWALSTGQKVAQFEGHSGAIKDIAYFRINDHLRILSASGDNMLKVWNGETNTLVSTLQGHFAPIIRATVAKNAPIALSISSDESAALWNLESMKLITRFYGEARPVCCAISDDGRLIMTGEMGGQVHIMRLEIGGEDTSISPDPGLG